MEGPSLVILKEQLSYLKGKTVADASGNAKIDFTRITGKKVKQIASFGKHFLITVGAHTIRIHFLMFGSYRINEQKETPVRLQLRFEKDEVNFYSCAVKFLDVKPDEIYDWSIDVMSDAWDEKKARKKLRAMPERNVGEALLDQDIFAGVGNIIKCEVLHRTGIHPESVIGKLPPRKLTALITEARNYSFDFYEWKKVFVLAKNWLVYKKKKCKTCGTPVSLIYTGETPRRSFYCPHCQTLYK